MCGTWAAAALAVVAAGCGDTTADGGTLEGEPTDPAPTGGSRPADDLIRLPATPLDAVGLEIPPDCPTPWLPAYDETEDDYPFPDPSTARRLALIGSAAERHDSGAGMDADTDGDGAPDEHPESAEGGAAFGLRRSDGDLVLAVPDGSVGAPGGRSRAGDLDGDGRDEVLVYVDDGTSPSYPLHVVPGTTPAGRHDPRVVGTRLPFDTTQGVMPVGDLDGDDRDDLAMPGPDGGFVVVGGPTIVAAAGGALPAGSAAYRLPGAPVTVLPLGDPARPVPLVAATPDAVGAHPPHRPARRAGLRPRRGADRDRDQFPAVAPGGRGQAAPPAGDPGDAQRHLRGRLEPRCPLRRVDAPGVVGGRGPTGVTPSAPLHARCPGRDSNPHAPKS